MIKYCLTLLLLIAAFSILVAQEGSEVVGIEVNITKDLQKVYIHKLQPKQTLYQLARTFDLPLVYLARINGIDQNATLSIGSEILIPIKDELIKSVKSSTNDVAVIYKVKPRETIFRISRIYFDKQIEELQRLNGLSSLKLDIDQYLQVGWIDLSIAPPKTTHRIEDDIPVKNDDPYLFVDTLSVDTISTTMIDSVSNISIVEEKDSVIVKKALPATYKRGIAYWNKTSSSTDLFVMHDSAKPQTEIELYNPLVNKRVIATVVARLPKNAYPSDINLVISPAVARQLGAIDSRFSVEMKYYK